MKKVLFGLLSLALITTTACKKSKDAPAFTKENVVGTYKLDKVTFKANGSAEQDVTSELFEACEVDDIVVLKSDFTYESQDAGAQCSGNYTGTWGIPAANKFEKDGETYDVTKWDGTTLGASTTDEFMPGVSGTMTMYFKKQ